MEVEINECKLKLDRNELNQLRRFHCKLFMDVLPIVQSFMQFDVFNKQNSYLIVPLTSGILCYFLFVLVCVNS